MHKLWKAVIAATMLGVAALPAHAKDQGKTITMGTMSWEDLVPITDITKKVLEEAGYKIKVTEFSDWGIAYAALSKGDVQVLASQIDYAAHDYWNRNKSRLEVISPVSFGLYQALAVPTYVPITSMTELNQNADKFGGKIVGIEPGSGLMRDTEKAVKAYGLKLRLVDGSTAAMTAALKSAIDRRDWIVVTIWEPSWMTQKYPVKFLSDPQHVYPPPQGYYWVGHKGFSKQDPHAREVMAHVYVPLADITAINGAVKDGKTMDQAVDDWIKSHAELIKRWESAVNN